MIIEAPLLDKALNPKTLNLKPYALNFSTLMKYAQGSPAYLHVIIITLSNEHSAQYWEVQVGSEAVGLGL